MKNVKDEKSTDGNGQAWEWWTGTQITRWIFSLNKTLSVSRWLNGELEGKISNFCY